MVFTHWIASNEILKIGMQQFLHSFFDVKLCKLCSSKFCTLAMKTGVQCEN
jgi:hypothetical protein